MLKAPSSRPEAARQDRTMSELVESALSLLFHSQRKREKIATLPTFRSGGTLVDIADRDALLAVVLVVNSNMLVYAADTDSQVMRVAQDPRTFFSSRRQTLLLISRSAAMPGDLHLRNVDDELIARLKRRAARHGRSAEAEHREILRQALRDEIEPSFDTLAAELRKLSKRRKQTPSEVLLRDGRQER